MSLCVGFLAGFRRRFALVAAAPLVLSSVIRCTPSSRCATEPPAPPLPVATPSAATPNDAAYRKIEVLASFLRKRNADSYSIKSATGIDEAKYVPIGGIEQWVTIRGENRENPVLLFLHGGPGDVTNPWSYAVFAPWLAQFTVVQWDQRGAGRTLRKSGSSVAATLTVKRLVDDGIELSEHLRQRLGKSKIIVVGHSFGSILGVMMARAKPDLFFAFVGTGQVADEVKNDASAYEALRQKARRSDDQQAKRELDEIGAPPRASGQGHAVQRKWANRFEGADRFLYGTLGWTLVAPGNSPDDINDSVDGQELSGERLVPETKSWSMKELGLEFAIPIFVFQGAEDFTTPTELARQYVDAIKAPKKEFVPIADGGHFAVFMKSEQFLKELVTRVRPLAQTTR
ncbi:MAG: alpha/beta fold hydrolase [Polyangiaceae bacterium]